MSQKGLIFHMIRGSFVDGYGVRTTVFLKGCPLRCIWCCNPEGQNPFPELKLTSSLCNLCGKCLLICPTNAIKINSEVKDEKIYVDRKLCTNCGKCVEVCYTGALDMFGKYITTDELFNIVKKDEEYYRKSGGGVTLGGGEPTFQPDFTYSMIKKCKENRIHIALDTCGYTTTEKAFTCLKEADLLLYDVKGIDLKEHLRNTTISNELILANLKKLDALENGPDVIVRAIIVPGYNDSEQDIRARAEFLSNLKHLIRVDILPYHEYGTVKYKQLGKEYKCTSKPPNSEYVESIKKIFEQHGIEVHIGG